MLDKAIKSGKEKRKPYRGAEDALIKFGKNLIKNQRPMPPEFQKTLNDNLWDLV